MQIAISRKRHIQSPDNGNFLNPPPIISDTLVFSGITLCSVCVHLTLNCTAFPWTIFKQSGTEKKKNYWGQRIETCAIS